MQNNRFQRSGKNRPLKRTLGAKMTKGEIIFAILSVPLIAVVTEKALFALCRWIRRDALVKDLAEKLVQSQKECEVAKQELAKRNDRQSIQNDLEIYRKIVYRSKKTGDTYCMGCWDGLSNLYHAVETDQGYYCSVCNKLRQFLDQQAVKHRKDS